MAKRLTDSEKWKDAWFMDLPSKYKLFWIYLLDECNHAGIWKVNFKVATFYIGEHLEHSEVKRILKDRIEILSDEYWFINKFIKYQYKCDIQELNPKNKAHLSAIKILNEYEIFKPLTSPLLGVKDKDKDNINNKKKIKEIEVEVSDHKIKSIVYEEKDFLTNWNQMRAHYLKTPSNLNRLRPDEKDLFFSIKSDFTKNDFHEALKGLFKQENIPRDIMHFRPKHFLDHIDTYLDAEKNKRYKLYA